MNAKLLFPVKNETRDPSFQPLVPHALTMLERGIDPKPMLIEFCEPMCVFWKDKLTRCERKLEKIIKVNPTKSCLYPMRDWVTCVEACVQPKIFNNLVRGERPEHIYT